MINPLKQFELSQYIKLDILGIDISITNSALFMLIVLLIIMVLGTVIVKVINKGFNNNHNHLVPTRFNALGEICYEMISNLAQGLSGAKVKPYVPFIFTLYIFILFCNLLGMLPGAFTITSNIVVTFGISSFLFVATTIIGFIRNGKNYFSIFFPSGTPLLLMPLMFIIELFTYFSRPISLSLRLTANMAAGHIVLKVIASFVTIAGVAGIIPLSLLVVLTGFEIFIAILQAYIFTILTCVYLNDALNMH